MKMLKVMFAVLCATALSLAAYAGDDKEKSQTLTDSEKMEFQRLDADKDGAISAKEAEDAGVEEFSKADKDGDGKLTLSEYAAIARNEVSSR